ncbi:MAG: beta-ketoacyl synthase chain length factor [Chitinophagaceae bacterium]
MFIHATGIVSPQPAFGKMLQSTVASSGNQFACIEPDYSTVLDPKLIRRMSRIIKMGVAAAMACLKEAGINNPDAIITGTAYGCLADTESFLTKMVENKEELLTPTAFIQSTHNTVGAQVALMLKCHNYNNTFVHRGFSFENSLLDALTLMKEGEASNILVGGVDEITSISHAILSRFGLYKNHSTPSVEIYNDKERGTVAGEGAVFFLLSDQTSTEDYAELKSVYTFYKPLNQSTIEDQVNSFLVSQSLTVKDIDLVICGKNGDPGNDAIYHLLEQSLFNGKQMLGYKHLCGEYPTSTAFAVWYAANILKTGAENIIEKKPKTVLIYNHYQQIHHSLYLLSGC